MSLADAARDDALFADIKAALLQHKLLFLREQNISRAEHVAFACRFGELEDHPVVRTHPETGEKVLFVNGFTTHFTNFHTPANVGYGQDFTQGTSALLQYLISQAAIPEYQVRWRWQPNSVAIWDNRSTQHYAVMDSPPCHRKMERAGNIGTPTF